MARIVGELQRFQSPYALVEVPELQAYLSQELEGLKRGQDAQSLCASRAPPRPHTCPRPPLTRSPLSPLPAPTDRQSLMIEPRQNSGPSSSAASIVSSQDSHRPRDIFNWRA